ncbi:hypothetical protein Tco_1579749, partial [Tanacetum coccineum]
MSNSSASTSNRRGKAKTTQPWTTTEDITLCTAWNWGEGTIREYHTIVAKWKHLIRPKVVAFSVRMDESGSSNLVLFQNALAELKMGTDILLQWRRVGEF